MWQKVKIISSNIIIKAKLQKIGNTVFWNTGTGLIPGSDVRVINEDEAGLLLDDEDWGFLNTDF